MAEMRPERSVTVSTMVADLKGRAQGQMSQVGPVENSTRVAETLTLSAQMLSLYSQRRATTGSAFMARRAGM